MIIKREPDKTTITMEMDDALVTKLEMLSHAWDITLEKLINLAMEKVVESSKIPIADKLNARQKFKYD